MITFDDKAFDNMISECKAIASDFKKKVIQQRTGLGPVINVDDIDEYEIGENDLVSLFERFKNVMGLRTTLGFLESGGQELLYTIYSLTFAQTNRVSGLREA